MNRSTSSQLIAAGLELFSQRGYDATSVRAITRRAGTNLGAITYHFGTKDGLYDAVIDAVAGPSREYLAQAVGIAGSPLDRIDRFVRGLFDYLDDHAELPRLITQHLAGSRPLPPALKRVVQANLQVLATLIAEGQRDGSIRTGDPQMLAPSIVAQPIYLTLARQILRDGVGIDLDDPTARRQLVESVSAFVREGLAKKESTR